jgi:antitoxin HicB
MMTTANTTLINQYPFEIIPLTPDDGGGFAITFPDLAGCRSDGATPEEAIANGREALGDWLAIAQEFGDEVPKPYAALSGKFVQRVPKSMHKQLSDAARSEGVSLNTLVVSLVAEGLGRRTRSANGLRRTRRPTAA